ncbi:MAG: response regulator [Acidaminococcaceae bacterium]|jgi:AmiR/NasT family two-component response regulator|nr:response regulator [Acidaminococcaceae bacterium]
MEKLKIIIADDEALIRMDLREMLAAAGHEIIAEGANGEEALEATRDLHPDLVIMDVKMPKMDGLTAAKLINEEQLAPVLLLTAYSQKDIVEQAKEAGVLAYIVKPVREEQLFPALEIAVSRFKEFQAFKAEVDQLRASLATRKLLDRAKGILMTAHGFTEQEAYRRMQQFSMNRRMSIKDVAQAIIDAATKASK